jgi:alkylation response protein AidB-like acyl-CoA dehydrogenase
MARAALEVAARYSDRRKAFGQKIRNFEGVSFKVADAITQLDEKVYEDEEMWTKGW